MGSHPGAAEAGVPGGAAAHRAGRGDPRAVDLPEPSRRRCLGAHALACPEDGEQAEGAGSPAGAAGAGPFGGPFHGRLALSSGGLLPLRAGAEGHAGGAVEPRQQRAAARGEAHVLGASECEGLGAKVSGEALPGASHAAGAGVAGGGGLPLPAGRLPGASGPGGLGAGAGHHRQGAAPRLTL